jgi:hypothetical protein
MSHSGTDCRLILTGIAFKEAFGNHEIDGLEIQGKIRDLVLVM